MSKTLYQRLFEGWPDPRLLIEAGDNASFRVRHANKVAYEYFSQAPGTLEGAAVDDFLEAANKAHILQAFAVVFRTGMPLTIQLIPVLPDGMPIRSFFLNPLRGDDGAVIAIDMTARLPVPDEDALKRERDDAMSIFTSIFDASDVGILVTDHNRRIVRVNKTFCEVYGWEAVEVTGEEFTILIPPDEHAIARERHDDMDGKVYNERSRELKILRKNGDLANVLTSSGVIELSGRRKFRISTLVDISTLKTIERDLRKAKEAADAASQAKSAFLANMSHELRTPLNAIIGFSDLMITGTLGKIENANYREYLGDIRFSAQHLLSIINDVLDMSKIEAGHMKLDVAPSDLAALLEEATRLVRARAQEHGIAIELNVPSGLRPVRVDQRMFRQVVLNLLSNAVKFSHPGGKVCVSAQADGPDWLQLHVCDDGIGIPEHKLLEVMQPFGQVSDPRVAKGQGTGLGLPLARAMVELHGGTLSIASVPDKGTTVTCRLPLEAG